MEKRIVRIKLTDSDFRRYKVFCAIADVSMTDQTNKLIKEFLKLSDENIKIVKINS